MSRNARGCLIAVGVAMVVMCSLGGALVSQEMSVGRADISRLQAAIRPGMNTKDAFAWLRANGYEEPEPDSLVGIFTTMSKRQYEGRFLSGPIHVRIKTSGGRVVEVLCGVMHPAL